MTETNDTKRDGIALLAVVIVIAMPLCLFRAFVFDGGIWIGNPDRLNTGLKILLFWLRGIADGHLHAWNEHELIGFDSLALQYTFPNPITWFGAAFDRQYFLVVQDWVVVVFLILAGIAALAFLRTLQCSWVATLVGASCYQLSALTILKVSQYDVSFFIFIIMPVVLALIHKVRHGRCPFLFMGLVTAMVFTLLILSLDHAKYALPLFGAYAAWRGLRIRRWSPVILTGATILIAFVVASPRIVGLIGSMSEYSRVAPGHDLVSFDGVYEFQNIRAYEILRWLDGTMFGISPSDTIRLGNNVNLSEGFLLSTSAAVPVLLLAALPRFQGRWAGLLLAKEQDIAFWSWTLLFTIAVVIWKPLVHALYLLFFSMDFGHARIILIGLPAMAAAIAVVLSRWSAGGKPLAQIAGLMLGLAMAILIELELVVWRVTGSRLFDGLVTLRNDALLRAATTVALSGILVLIMRATRPTLAAVAHAALAGVIVTQAFLAADLQINGAQTMARDGPFYLGDMYMARDGEFNIPVPQQIQALRARTRGGRVALVCPVQVADGYCAGHLSETWQLRTVDGYYGLGVPKRIRNLPWGKAEGLRSISFTSADELPWPLLGFLNAGKALVVSIEFYKNREANGIMADVERIQILDNPERIVPRAFLAASAEPVNDFAQASQAIFSGDRPQDIQMHSFVEGLGAGQTFDAQGEVTVSGNGDHLELDVSSTTGKRLLVVNELFMPGWSAFVDGIETQVLPANIVMRAVVLPPDAKRVVMEYRPFVRTSGARLLYGLGTVLIGCGLVLTIFARRHSHYAMGL